MVIVCHAMVIVCHAMVIVCGDCMSCHGDCMSCTLSGPTNSVCLHSFFNYTIKGTVSGYWVEGGL